MAYDYFREIGGNPNVSVSLYGDAARAGIAAGNALPTPLTAGIQGAIKGFEQGQQFVSNAQKIEAQSQENQIRQNQIDMQPVANQLQQVQLENARKVNEINNLKLEQQVKTQQMEIDAATSKAKADKAKFDEEYATFQTKQRISDTLAGGDPKSVLTDPEMQRVIFSDSDYANSVMGALASRNVLSDEEQQDLYKRVDFKRSQELKAKEASDRAKAQAKLVGDLDKIEKSVEDSATLSVTLNAAGIKHPNELLRKKIEIVPTGQKQYIKDEKTGLPTNVVDTSKPDLTNSTADTFDLIIDGKRAPQFIKNDRDASALTKYINAARTAYGIPDVPQPSVENPPATVQEPEQKGFFSKWFGSSESPKPPRSKEQISGDLAAEGLSTEQTASILTAAYDQGYGKTAVSRLISDILPKTDPISGVATPNFYESDYAKQAREMTQPIAIKMAEEKLAILESNDSKAKEELRNWAKAENVILSKDASTFGTAKKSLVQYYQDRLIGDLGQAYREMEEQGVLAKQQIIRNENAVEAAQAMKESEYKGKTPEQVMARLQSRRAAGEKGFARNMLEQEIDRIPDFSPYADRGPSEVGMIENLDAKIEDVAAKYNLPKSKAEDMKRRAERVSTNEYLESQPSYIKAIAAVESGGVNNAVSKTNVKGLMQVTKGTADRYRKDDGTPYNRLNPQDSVEVATKYYNDLLTMFNGSKMLAYAAYNAGEGVIQYARRLAGGSTDWEDVKEYLLPALQHYAPREGWNALTKLRETINYPEKVAMHEELFVV